MAESNTPMTVQASLNYNNSTNQPHEFGGRELVEGPPDRGYESLPQGLCT